MKRFSVFFGLALFAAVAARADNLVIENVTLSPRDATTAIIQFDIGWTNAWGWGNFHDAAWVFFKVKPTGPGAWQPARLVANVARNPSGFFAGEGTPLDFIVPADRLGVFVRLAKGGSTQVSAKGVTVLCDAQAANTMVRGCAIEMIYVAEGAFYLGSGGTELNRLYQWTDGKQENKPYRVTGAGAIPTGRQKDKLWASGIAPEDGGEIAAAFPNGYPAFYAMKHSHITLGQYAAFLNTLSEAEADKQYYPGFFSGLIERSGDAPDRTYATAKPHKPCPWLSWRDGALFAAWAGLRPMTELEYEKAIRGYEVPEPNDAYPSYWGLAGANMAALERVVSAGSAEGRKFSGTHGQGTVTLPKDWPTDLDGFLFRGKPLPRSYYGHSHLQSSGRLNATSTSMVRSRSIGWRAARTAPAESAVQDPGHFDAGIVHRVAPLTQPPRLDGAPDGWGERLAILDTPANLFPVYFRFVPYDFFGIKPPWRGPQDLSATMYLAADKEALYIAAVVTDDQHVNTQSRDGIAGGDAIQIGLITPNGSHWNAALALTTNGVAFHQYAGEGESLLQSVNCAVTRDDQAGVTRYGLRLPLATIGLTAGDEFGFNCFVLDSDDGKRVSFWLRLAPGIEYPWRTELYPRLVLAK